MTAAGLACVRHTQGLSERDGWNKLITMSAQSTP